MLYLAPTFCTVSNLRTLLHFNFWVSSEKMDPDRFSYQKQKGKGSHCGRCTENVWGLNMCSCDEIKIDEARDHLFFTIMSRSGAIIF